MDIDYYDENKTYGQYQGRFKTSSRTPVLEIIQQGAKNDGVYQDFELLTPKDDIINSIESAGLDM